ncbi:hypothetical protein ES708_23825 [subsurface metagenome]
MKCPITMAMLGSYSKNVVVEPRDCLKEQCGGWDSIVEQCSIVTIGWALSGIQGYLSLIEDKMPHEEQFRK